MRRMKPAGIGVGCRKTGWQPDLGGFTGVPVTLT